MNKKRILVPIDGTERSMYALDFIKEIFPKDAGMEIIIMNIKELVLINEMIVSEEVKIAKELGKDILEAAKKKMDGYNVETYFTFGYPGDEIIKKAKDEDVGIKRGLSRMIGSVTASVVKKAKCIVMVVPNDFTISLK